MSIRVLSNKKLAPFLKRHMQMVPVESELRLDHFLRLALEKAGEFVPSEAGSIFLDDPQVKWTRDRIENSLSAVACFGPRGAQLLGKKIPANRGIVGRVYVSGQAYFSADVRRDPHFASDRDRVWGDRARSVICVPISIRSSMIGVLELINKKGNKPYTIADFELLKIFADYISASVQNFLDAKRNADKAKQDNLTGLSNDRQLFARLAVEVPRAWRSKTSDLSLLFLDLDGFKQVNDVHGHLAGSRVLVEVAEVLRLTVHWKRAEIVRYGGDEYVVLLPGAKLVDAVAVAEDIQRAIERTVFLAEPSQDVPALRIADQITASVGVACLKAHAKSRDHNLLIKLADQAMYEAKRRGRNRVIVAQAAGRRKGRAGEATQ